jgi:DNA repair protein RecN (Recombination protein N)
MLASLRIRNLALVEDLIWEPPSGFVAVTGETGAGKSIIIGAIKLLLGERADKGVLRSGADVCVVEGSFEVSTNSFVHAMLEEAAVEPCEGGQLIMKRTLPVSGAGKQYVNGSPCALALLKRLGDQLVDLHGPHDHQSLFSCDEQLRLVDSHAGTLGLRTEFFEKRREWMLLVAEKKSFSENAEAIAREIDLLEHQVEEISGANLRAGEEEELMAKQRIAAHSKRLMEICSSLRSIVSDSDDSMVARWGEIARSMREMHRIDPETASMQDAAGAIFESLQDFSRAVDCYSGRLDGGSENLAAIEDRLDLIQTLKRKYGSTLDEVLRFGAEASTKMEALQRREERREGLDEDIAKAAKLVEGVGEKLSQARRLSAPKLEKLVKAHLVDLGFVRAGFSISFQKLDSFGIHGMEGVDFLFAPNPGEPERPLRSIASSGEISRVMLSIKTALAGVVGVPVLVFDEIDANVGGEIGAKVGAKMDEISRCHQVFCITHLPQVAAWAVAHFSVRKEVEGGRTKTLLMPVVGQERVEEVARMLGGRSDSAQLHAQVLLSNVSS